MFPFDPWFPLVPFVVLAAIVLAIGVLAHLAGRRRREALALFAARHGFRYGRERDRDLARRFAFLEGLAQGSDRYAENVIGGRHRGRDVTCFDYHYATRSTDSDGKPETVNHYVSCYTLALGRSFPELTVGPEGVLSKLAQTVGYDDIDFESHAFSSAYCVRSRDKRFAYDVCNPRMIEYLLERPGTRLEVERDVLATVRSDRMQPEGILAMLDLLIDVRERMPDYLFEAAWRISGDTRPPAAPAERPMG